MRAYSSVGAVGLIVMIYSSAVESKDLNALAEFVQPAYTAMNFATLCARNDSQFLSDTSGPRGTILQYAEHVKNEATKSLNQADAFTILKSAADGARLVARSKLYELVRPGDDNGTIKAIDSWCALEAKRFILGFIRGHDVAHSQYDEFLERAKKQ
jgi:hypothetical protein